MKVLWSINIIPPEAMILSGMPDQSLSFSGGWLMASAQALVEMGNIELHIACPSHIVDNVIHVKGMNFDYHIFPSIELTKDFKRLQNDFDHIVREVQPDIIDIHGTEYAHSLACLRAGKKTKTVVTLQGIIRECARHYYDGLTCKDILLHRRPFHHGIYHEAHHFKISGDIENKVLKESQFVIGRTSWDKACALSINPNARYFHCNESLRDSFYLGQWQYDACEAHSMFVTQASYPIKGLHQVIKALPLVLSRYPDAKLYIGGPDILKIWEKHRSNYNRIVVSLLKKHHLLEHVVFTDILDEQQMKERLLKSNVFISPSTIENSSNSLCEAQMLGLPCIASCVGGTTDIIPDKGCGTLYRFEDTDHLAQLICDCFETSARFDNHHEREIAHTRHDKKKNAENLLQIYQSILDNEVIHRA